MEKKAWLKLNCIYRVGHENKGKIIKDMKEDKEEGEQEKSLS
jgi:hypothetical protein